MKQSIFTILSNTPLTDCVYKMVLSGDTSAITAPGQFVNIQITGKFLRRPISVCDYDGSTLTIVYKVVGKGTEIPLPDGSRREAGHPDRSGQRLRPYPAGDSPVLLGGGVGVPPLYHLAKRLLAMGKQVTVILGFNTQSEVFYEAEFRALGCRVIVTTADGSYGVKGFATTPLNDLNYSYFYTCGPEPMLKAVYKATAPPPDEL